MVGPNLEDIQRVYVRFDDYIYEIPTFLKALDILFKYFLAFSVEYPNVSEEICYLIQWAVYNIRLQSGMKIPRALAITKNISKLEIEI